MCASLARKLLARCGTILQDGFYWVETREHGQEHSQTQAQGSSNDHRCSYAIGMQLCLLCTYTNLANTVI